MTTHSTGEPRGGNTDWSPDAPHDPPDLPEWRSEDYVVSDGASGGGLDPDDEQMHVVEEAIDEAKEAAGKLLDNEQLLPEEQAERAQEGLS